MEGEAAVQAGEIVARLVDGHPAIPCNGPPSPGADAPPFRDRRGLS
jgi:hypothetical protein